MLNDLVISVLGTTTNDFSDIASSLFLDGESILAYLRLYQQTSQSKEGDEHLPTILR